MTNPLTKNSHHRFNASTLTYNSGSNSYNETNNNSRTSTGSLDIPPRPKRAMSNEPSQVPQSLITEFCGPITMQCVFAKNMRVHFLSRL